MNQDRQRKLTKRRWFVLLASCLINLCIGSLYAWSVFAVPVVEHISSVTGTSLNASNLAIVFTIANSVGHNSVNYGIMFVGFTFAGYLRPTIMSALHERMNSYSPAFLFAMGLVALGVLLSILYRKISVRQEGHYSQFRKGNKRCIN